MKNSMKFEIKECTKFGSGGHVVLSIEDVGKKFLILPESSKFILMDILQKYHEALEDATNPLLSDFLTPNEFETLKQVYRRKIDNFGGYLSGVHKKLMESNYRSLNKFKLKDIGAILNHIEDSLPKVLKKKLISEYYKSNKK